MEEILLIRWFALYALVSVWRRGKREKHMRVLARLAGPGRSGAGRGVARQWAKIRPKASQVHDLLLPFIFAMSLCLICFDRDRPSWLRDAVTLGRSFLYIRATVTEIATDQQPRKYQHI
jgi:hypothetical protein